MELSCILPYEMFLEWCFMAPLVSKSNLFFKPSFTFNYMILRDSSLYFSFENLKSTEKLKEEYNKHLNIPFTR